MTNEELLEALNKQFAVIDQRFDAIDQRLENLGTEVVKTNLMIENEIQPQINLLAEGHKTILETLAPKNRVEALEDEVSFLKQMIKTLASEVSELKKAQ